MDQFLDQHGLADACTAEQTDLAALCIGGQQVDDLDAGLQDLGRGLLLCLSLIHISGPDLKKEHHLYPLRVQSDALVLFQAVPWKTSSFPAQHAGLH